ncbi:expressed unknown protein [Seminavis robusta]|uniref:Uncharacterized protein n=1 Tax=Seminavis robusta TaxID=568900 RepID=A0A9N8HN09_9STRA|nr:expressed unknown protein [Seminavis robusta]|eukprot:Sro947_g223380.1 n/a (373) ;mRNA; f:7229-8347
MTMLSSLLLLPLLLVSSVAASDARSLQIADWSVDIGTISSQSFSFSTGAGGGANPNIKVSISNLCRSESDTRTEVGEFFPASTVSGIEVDSEAVRNNPGPDNALSFNFVEGIDSNDAIFADNGDGTAAVVFCALVGLYDQNEMVNFSEIKLTYSLDLMTSVVELTGYVVSGASTFQDALDTSIHFDGELSSYFCDSRTQESLTNSSGTTTQGSVISVCFTIPDPVTEFRVADILDLTISNANDLAPSQSILIAGVEQSFGSYVSKRCRKNASPTGTDMCQVDLILGADFYDFNALNLTGSGVILLEFGSAAGARALRQEQRSLQVKNTMESVEVDQYSVTLEKRKVTTSGAMTPLSIVSSVATLFGLVAGIV